MNKVHYYLFIAAVAACTAFASCQSGGDEPTFLTESDTLISHEAVDLGLSVKWAACNIGADSPEDYGNYYAWGETKTKDEYNSDNCDTYGVELEDISGNAEYDAATANWGGSWRMPTLTEMEELVYDCIWIWVTQNSVNGYLVTGSNGNSIFLPAAGSRVGSSLSTAGRWCMYWTSYRSGNYYWDNCAFHLIFSRDGRPSLGGSNSNHYMGLSVRPVSE